MKKQSGSETDKQFSMFEWGINITDVKQEVG
jgi:hypothetical protein